MTVPVWQRANRKGDLSNSVESAKWIAIAPASKLSATIPTFLPAARHGWIRSIRLMG
jgi:hypothetical protein